jgi:hypothetical protein
MSILRSLMRRVFRQPNRCAFHCRRSSRARAGDTRQVEALESRQLLSTSPFLTGVQILGTVKAATGVVLTFDDALDPTTAQDLQTYAIGKLIPASPSDSTFSIGNILGLLAQPKAAIVKNGRIQFTSATYDVTSDTVTLATNAPWNAQGFFRFIRIWGTGPDALKDFGEAPLNGGNNTYIHWFPYITKRFTYIDPTGDRVTLVLKGRGQMEVFLPTNSSHVPIIFVNNGNANTILTGTVRQGRFGIGVAPIGEIQGLATIQTTLTTDPVFAVQATQP